MSSTPIIIQRSSSSGIGGGTAAHVRPNPAPACTLGHRRDLNDFIHQLPSVIRDSNQAPYHTPPTSRKWLGVCILTGLGAFGGSFLSDASIGKSIGLGLLAGTTLFSLVRGYQKYLNAPDPKPEKQPSEVLVLNGLQEGNLPVRISLGVPIEGGNRIPEPKHTKSDDGISRFYYDQEDLNKYNKENGYAILKDDTETEAFHSLRSQPGSTLFDRVKYDFNLLIFCQYYPVHFETNRTYLSPVEAQTAFLNAIRERESQIQSALTSPVCPARN